MTTRNICANPSLSALHREGARIFIGVKSSKILKKGETTAVYLCRFEVTALDLAHDPLKQRVPFLNLES